VPLLAVERLSKRFGSLNALTDVSLEVEAGAIQAIIGPNGAGKTTLFNLVTGIVRPDAGAIRLDGERIDGLAAHRRTARGLARTFQNIRLFPSLSVL
jgi:branched-chain amino acid transport system ATP-binding protein